MKKRPSTIPPDPYAGFVEHPRYGRRPRFTSKPDPVEQGWSGPHFHFHSSPEERIPGTAIAADLARQCPATIAVTHYFDTKRACLDCRRPFIFFAAEQKHWYETLHFPLEANCVRCPVCRKRTQVLSRVRREHDTLAKVRPRTMEQNLAMAGCVLTLVEAGVFPPRQLEKVRMLLKRVPHRGPTGPRCAPPNSTVDPPDHGSPRQSRLCGMRDAPSGAPHLRPQKVRGDVKDLPPPAPERHRRRYGELTERLTAVTAALPRDTKPH